jgi:uncharacterized protein (DUF433 family)
VLIQLGLGRGIYSVPEAAALTGISTGRIRRWFLGYKFKALRGERKMPRLLAPEYPIDEVGLHLSFLDLVEVRVVDAFLRFGVGWRELRSAAQVGAELFGTAHPFSTVGFKTDGRRLFADVPKRAGEAALVQVRDRQQVFRQVVGPILIDLDFRGEIAHRWWPLGKQRLVMLDPEFAFGAPVTAQSGVPVRVLAEHAARSSVESTARWFEVSKREVRDAVAFQDRMAA